MCDVRARVISCVEEGVVNGAPAVDALLCEQLLKDGKVHRVRVEERAVDVKKYALDLARRSLSSVPVDDTRHLSREPAIEILR